MTMLLQNNGRPQALQTLIGTEGERGTDFLQLTNASAALYPPGNHRKI